MRLTSAFTPAARRRCSPLLLGLALSLSLAACTSGGGESEGTQKPQLTYEEAKAQVPINGDEREPLTWRVDPFPNPDTAAAAEAAQHYFIVFDVLGSAQRPVDTSYFELLSHFTTDEWLHRIQRWFPTADWSPPPHHFEFTGPRWVWIIDVSELPDNDLMVSFCIDTSWYGYNPDGGFKKVEERLRQGWAIDSYRVREVSDADVPRWKVDDFASIYGELPDDEVADLEDACSEWANHEWTPAMLPAANGIG